MNSEENNGPADNNSGDQVSMLSLEFKVEFNRKLDEKLQSLKKDIAEITLENAVWKENMKSRCAKMKETRKEIKASKQRIQELQKTLDNVQKSLRDRSDYNQLLKSGLKKYEDETIAMEKEHQESIDDMDNKWKIYQAKYETLPLAVQRTEERNRLQRAKVELMVKEYKLADMKKTVSIQEEIDTKRRNDLVIECAELYKEFKIEDVKMRVASATEKSLREEILQQERMIAQLTEKQSQELAASQQSVAEKSDETLVSMFTPLQIRSQPIPHLDLSSFVNTSTQSTPIFRKADYDTISITSSVIDNLIEPVTLPQTEANRYAPGYQDNDQTRDAAFFDPNEKAIAVEEDHPMPSSDEKRLDSVIDYKEDCTFEKYEEEPAADERSFDSQKTEEYDSSQVMDEVEDCGDANDQKAGESVYPSMNEAPAEKHGHDFLAESNLSQQLELGETPTKRPRITNIENVQLNMMQKNMVEPKPSPEDPLARYFAASNGSSADYNWKGAMDRSNLFSYQDSQRGSETSMQSVDFMKKFNFSFSSNRGDRVEYESSVGERESQFVTPRAGGPGPSQIGGAQTAPPFLDMGNLGTPNSRGKKKEPFFLNMF